MLAPLRGERPPSALPRRLGVALVLVAIQAIFAGYAIIVKMVMENQGVDALVFSLYRDVGASIVLLGCCYLAGALRPVAKGDLGLFLLMGLLGVTFAQTAMVLALQWVPPFNVSLLQPSQPVLTLLLGLLLRMEALSLRSAAGVLKVVGIFLGCAGATFTVLMAARGGGTSKASTGGASGSGLLLGNVLLVLECVGGALFQLLNKRLTSRYPSICVAAYGYCLGRALLALAVLPLRAGHAAVWALPPAGCAALAYAVLLASAFNYFAYAWAARRSTASHVTAFFPLQVVFTAVLQVAVLREWPTPWQLGGALAIVVALLCVVASLAYDDTAGGAPKTAAADADDADEEPRGGIGGEATGPTATRVASHGSLD